MAYILQITLPDGTTYDLKDSTAVTNVSWDSTNWKIQKTINGTTSDVVTLPLISGTGTNSAVGGEKTTNAACVASGDYSFAFGSGAQASSQCQIAMGRFNIEDNQDTYAFILGNGTANNARSNAMTVDWNGNIGANNIVTSTSVSNTGLISFLNSNSTAVYTVQLPLYNGGVS